MIQRSVLYPPPKLACAKKLADCCSIPVSSDHPSSFCELRLNEEAHKLINPKLHLDLCGASAAVPRKGRGTGSPIQVKLFINIIFFCFVYLFTLSLTSDCPCLVCPPSTIIVSPT